jgi:transposase
VRQQENISRKLAERFKGAKSFVQRLLKRFEETGDISLIAQGGSPPTKLTGRTISDFSGNNRRDLSQKEIVGRALLNYNGILPSPNMSQLREYIEKHPSETQRLLGLD